ncbi:putative protein OS=Streptomyces griseomycini OX=66895 GN=FHS37_003805 PE=4 SV=1 [Streptomyces griseomycini]|uniref:Uncharacterized protein n=1 Tax=Streptomyces griseomycini TaxID=66895 RepID=A0A7W7M0R8_9ACTN|nr:hypothetical protein [Streptomyces griseomycini]
MAGTVVLDRTGGRAGGGGARRPHRRTPRTSPGSVSGVPRTLARCSRGGSGCRRGGPFGCRGTRSGRGRGRGGPSPARSAPRRRASAPGCCRGTLGTGSSGSRRRAVRAPWPATGATTPPRPPTAGPGPGRGRAGAGPGPGRGRAGAGPASGVGTDVAVGADGPALVRGRLRVRRAPSGAPAAPSAPAGPTRSGAPPTTASRCRSRRTGPRSDDRRCGHGLLPRPRAGTSLRPRAFRVGRAVPSCGACVPWAPVVVPAPPCGNHQARPRPRALFHDATAGETR